MHILNELILEHESKISKENIQNVLSRWEQPHRFYHNKQHLEEMLDLIYESLKLGEISETERVILTVATIYHDAIYIPGSKTNEQESAELFLQHCDPDWEHKERVYNLIMDTKSHIVSSDNLSEKIIHFDLYYLRTGDLGRLIKDGMRTMKEFQGFPYNAFKQGRIAFLNEAIDSGIVKNNVTNVRAYLNWLENYKPNIGIFAGSFNPFHRGHYDILQKAEKIFDKVILAVGVNPEKELNDEDYKRILENFPEVVKNREITFFDCYLTEFVKMKEEEGTEITIIKGIRNSSDLESELTQLRYMEDQDPNTKIVYIPADRNLTHVSSRFVRELESRETGSGAKYLF